MRDDHGFTAPMPGVRNPAALATAQSCRLWTLYRNPSIARCELSATAGGFEVRLFLNHLMLVSRLFSTPSEAMAYADAEKLLLMAQDWSMIADHDD